MHLIGFTGLKGSGKDTAASVLVENGFEPQKMAGGLKAMLRALLDYQGVDVATIERMLEGDLKEETTPFLGGRTPRYAMQTLGTEWGRDLMSEDLWLSALGRRLPLFAANVISDVRFPNEVRMIRYLGGVVFRIERGATPPDMHPSEALIPTLDVNLSVENNFDTADAFRGFVASIIRAYLPERHAA